MLPGKGKRKIPECVISKGIKFLYISGWWNDSGTSVAGVDIKFFFHTWSGVKLYLNFMLFFTNDKFQ